MRSSADISISEVVEVCRNDPDCFRCKAPLPPNRNLDLAGVPGDAKWALLAQLTGAQGQVRAQAVAICLRCAEDFQTFIDGVDAVEPPPRANANGDSFALKPLDYPEARIIEEPPTFEGLCTFTDHKNKGQ